MRTLLAGRGNLLLPAGAAPTPPLRSTKHFTSETSKYASIRFLDAEHRYLMPTEVEPVFGLRKPCLRLYGNKAEYGCHAWTMVSSQ